MNLHDDLYFFDDGERFLWASERSGHAHLYLYDMEGRLVRQVTRGEWAIRASADVSWTRRAIAWVDEKKDQVYFTAQEASSIEKQLYRIGLDGQGLERLTKEEGVHRVLFRDDGRYYLDAHSAIDPMSGAARPS